MARLFYRVFVKLTDHTTGEFRRAEWAAGDTAESHRRSLQLIVDLQIWADGVTFPPRFEAGWAVEGFDESGRVLFCRYGSKVGAQFKGA
jgi:hypothetical protein